MLYHCPGHSHPIDRAQHLGRLAAFQPECRDCVHRHDTDLLPPSLVKQLRSVWQHEPVGARFTAEDVEGIHRNQIAPADVRALGAAFGRCLHTKSTTSSPRVVLAGDARPIVPELILAAAEGLRWAGCHVLDVGTGTCGSTAFAIGHTRADGGMFVGNARPEPHRVSLKFWGREGLPFSAPGQLSRLQTMLALSDDRPTRRSGALDRVPMHATYLDTLRNEFHALRPLRFVVDTSCKMLTTWLTELAQNVACEVMHVQDTASTPASPPLPRSVDRTKSLARRVVDARAHFGMAIDGDGEVCQFIDELGQPIAIEHVLVALANDRSHRPSMSSVVVEETALRSATESFTARGVSVHRVASTRAAMHAAMRENQAMLGAGPSGRIWLETSAGPTVDALALLARWLKLLSQSDRPVSQVVAESLVAAPVTG